MMAVLPVALPLLLAQLAVPASPSPAAPLPNPASACAPQTPAFGAVLTEGSRGPTGIGVGDPFLIVLKSNPSTGYGWKLTGAPSKAMARVEGDVYVSDASLETPAPQVKGQPPMVMVGGGGIDVFHLTMLQSGTSTFTFSLYPPGRSTPARTTAFTVNAFPRPPLCP